MQTRHLKMTKETQTKIKQTAADTGRELPKDPWMWFILIEAIASQVLGYWAMIAPMMGDVAPYVQGGLAVYRAVILGVKSFRMNSIKVGGTK